MELEAWFLADLPALLKAELINEASFHFLSNELKEQDMDSLITPKALLKNHIQNFREITCATRIAPHLNLNNKTSPSFALFIKTLRDFTPKLS